jgi:hypothetical protein
MSVSVPQSQLLMEMLKAKMNSFILKDRKDALRKLMQAKEGFFPEVSNVNLHFHSFYSYNCQGWSPVQIAYESKRRGLYAAGIIDFDVIDGRDEFLEAAELLGLRATVGIETRAFHTEYANLEIDSPGEPGVSYIAGSGFVVPLDENAQEAKILAEYRSTAKERNIALISRINSKLPIIAIDYEIDVVPLTPSGNVTERHIIQAYIKKSVQHNPEKIKLYNFWSEVLGKPKEDIQNGFDNMLALEDLVRTKLSKKGGVGYAHPTSETFPKVEDFFAWTRSCGGVPMESWLDGMSKGEEDSVALLEISRQKGAAGLNIIPDRNWNIKDPEVKARKYYKLVEIVQLAESIDFPLNIGTEMNKIGLPFVDDLEGDNLKPFKNQFQNGAKILIGHSTLQRFAGFSYANMEADEYFNKNIKAKNNFFASVGSLPPINLVISDTFRNAGKEKSFALIHDAVKKGRWSLKMV